MARTITIEFPNDSQLTPITEGILDGSLSVERSLCTSSTLTFDELNSALFKVSLQNIDDITGQEIYVHTLEDDGSKHDIFYGIVNSANAQKTGVYRDIIAYDLLYTKKNIDVGTWYNSMFENPTDRWELGTFRKKLCEFLGLNVKETTLPFDNIVIGKTLDSTSFTADVLLSAICALNCVFGVMIGDTLNFVSLSETAIDITDKAKTSSEYEDFKTLNITGVKITDSSENLGALAGVDDNNYTLVGNVFTLDLTSATNLEIANTILTKLKNISYTPMTVEMILPDFSLGLGSKISYKNMTGYILTENLSGTGLYTQTFSCSGESTARSSEVETNELVKILNRSYIRLKAEQDEFNVLIHGEDGIESQIKQINNQIVLKVDSNGKLVEVSLSADPTDGTEFKVSADNIQLTAEEAISFMAGGTIDMAAKNIYIKADNFAIDKDTGLYLTNGNTYVSLNPSGDNIEEIGTLPDPGYKVEQSGLVTASENGHKVLSDVFELDKKLYRKYSQKYPLEWRTDYGLEYYDFDTNSWIATVYGDRSPTSDQQDVEETDLIGGIVYNSHNTISYTTSSGIKYYYVLTDNVMNEDGYLYLVRFSDINLTKYVDKLNIPIKKRYAVSFQFDVNNKIVVDNYLIYICASVIFKINLETFTLESTYAVRPYSDDTTKPKYQFFTASSYPTYYSNIEYVYLTGWEHKSIWETSDEYKYAIFRYSIKHNTLELVYNLNDINVKNAVGVQIQNKVHLFGCDYAYVYKTYKIPSNLNFHMIYDTVTGEITTETDMIGVFCAMANTDDSYRKSYIRNITVYNDKAYFTLYKLEDSDDVSFTRLDDNVYTLYNTEKNPDGSKLFYVTNDGQLYIKGIFQADKIETNSGKIGGFTIEGNALKSEIDTDTTTNSITLAPEGFYSRGLDKSNDFDSFARLYNGKLIFGDYVEENPYAVTDQYMDVSVKGIFCQSEIGAKNIFTRQLFRVDLDNDTVEVNNSSSSSPGLAIINRNVISDSGTEDSADATTENGNGCALYIRNEFAGYSNAPFLVECPTYGNSWFVDEDGTVRERQGRDRTYVVIFGEGYERNNKNQGDRVIFRSHIIKKSEDGTKTYDKSLDGSIGSTGYRWNWGYFNNLYSTNAVSTSDAKKKDVVKEITYADSNDFIKSLTPYEYTFKDSDSKRVHMGFLAQDVDKKIKDLNMGNMAICEAAWIKDNKELYYSEDAPEEELEWGLKYNEFIAPMIKTLQYLLKENEEKTKKIEELESIIKKFK